MSLQDEVTRLQTEINALKTDRDLLIDVYDEAVLYVADYKDDGSVETAQATSMDAAILAGTGAAKAKYW